MKNWVAEGVAFDVDDFSPHGTLLISLIFIIYRLSSCGSSITQNITYIQNPSYPTAYSTTGTCVFSVTPVSSGTYYHQW